MTDIDKHQGFSDDDTEAYQRHGYPFWIKLMFILLIVWGVAYSGYFILTGFDSEALYDKRFALTLLDRAFAQVGQRYRSHSPERAERYEALRPYLLGEGERSYRETGEALGLSETAVKVAVHRLRTLFREALRREVAETLADPADVDAEIRHLATALRGGRANGGTPDGVGRT